VKMVFGNTPGPGRPAPHWVGWTRPLCHIVPLCLIVHEHPLVLDIIKICMDFGPYGAFSSSDVPEMVDQQNS
jgi:hypothetical protein